MGARLKQFKLSGHGGFLCLRENSGDLALVHGLETFDSLERLVEDLDRVDPGDHDRRRGVEPKVKGFDRSYRLALKYVRVSEGLHGENGCAVLLGHRRNLIEKRK